MDKYEYQVRSEEILSLIREGEYAQACEIADSIDWRRVRNIPMLCRISDLYKANRRYQESKEILLLAYEKHPNGRLIVYSLCELSIKLEEYVQAIEYYKEFVQLAPQDTGRYILQYRLYEAQEVTLEERIAVLEEFKKKDYREKWAYELAYLYHRVGLSTKCVEECDEMFLWFGEGRYILKALELKMLHAPLSAQQQRSYDEWTGGISEEPEEELRDEGHGGQMRDTSSVTDIKASMDTTDLRSMPPQEGEDLEIQVKPVDTSNFNTINLRQELAESMKELMGAEESEVAGEPEVQAETYVAEAAVETLIPSEEPEETSAQEEEPRSFGFDSGAMRGMSELLAEVEEEEPEPEPEVSVFAQEPTGREIETVLPEEPTSAQPETDQIRFRQPAYAQEQQITAMWNPEEVESELDLLSQETKRIPVEEIISYEEAHRVKEELRKESAAVSATTEQAEQVPGAKTGKIPPIPSEASKFDHLLSQEADGQISLAVPEDAQVEKQITGQLSFEDIMAEWERMKLANEQKRMDEVRKRILQHTGSLFDEFDEATKNGLLEQLEQAFFEAIMREAEGVGPYGSGEALNRQIVKTAKKAADETAGRYEEEAEEEDLWEEEDAEAAEADMEAEEAAEEILEEPEETSEEEQLPEDEEESEAEETPDEEDVPTDDEAYAEAEDAGEEVTDEEYEEEEYFEEESDAEEEDPEGDATERMEDEPESEAVRKVIESMEGEDEPEEDVSEVEEVEEEQERELSEEEKEIFGSFIHRRKTREQVLHALDNMSMAAYTGNVVISGEEETGTLDLAKALIREMQASDSNFLGQIAKVSGQVLNKKNIPDTLGKLSGGALIIEAAGGLSNASALKLVKALNTEGFGILVILEDEKQAIEALFEELPELEECFNIRIDLDSLGDEALVAYAKEYAAEQEYSIDEFAILALHTRIAEMQTSDHEVTVADVRQLVDDAIYYASKKTPKHLMQVVLSKRYDSNDMIILREKDFMHY